MPPFGQSDTGIVWEAIPLCGICPGAAWRACKVRPQTSPAIARILILIVSPYQSCNRTNRDSNRSGTSPSKTIPGFSDYSRVEAQRLRILRGRTALPFNITVGIFYSLAAQVSFRSLEELPK